MSRYELTLTGKFVSQQWHPFATVVVVVTFMNSSSRLFSGFCEEVKKKDEKKISLTLAQDVTVR